MTNCLRGIRNAWHFYYALNLVIKVVCSGFGIALQTPKQGVMCKCQQLIKRYYD
ncbi:TPA: DUF3265 domain-containing protein [Vibrio fluvialis]|nr:DUF3265 domain-containing protein [Vibrio fluvialis]